MSNRGMPSMTALLALLAVAGFQNRDKIGEILGQVTGGAQLPGGQPGQNQGGLGGMLGGLAGGGGAAGGGLGGLLGSGGLGGLLGGGSLGGILSGGLGGLLDQFQQNGHGDVANSWVKDGPNAPIETNQLEQAIGPDVLAQLAQQTGLSREELLSRLSTTLPKAVDQLTPAGRVPTEDEASKFVA